MAIFIPSKCYPLISGGNNSARWWRDTGPCFRRSIGFVFAASVGDSAIKVAGPSGSLESYKSAFVITSCGTIDTYYYETFAPALSSIAVLVDVFKMHDDGLWTSSAAFTVTGTSPFTSSRLFVNTYDRNNTSATAYTIHDSGSVTTTAGTVGCGFTPAKTWTVTVYDDGSTTLA